ncbi:related to KRE9 Cell wall synthesis protein [Phialocephala subalpina]|uniref:Related to KRE9 Cell wall synthesis protein n=1 Tax=Phialocephala subalpina TaxID=576137 RepID=A0A1L7X8V7_9HELO|nr:related to KRE9 Cell wall synthesis protein [Phialocephala subalpina]
MRLSSNLLFLVASAPLAFAYPEFTVPAAGASVPGGTAFSVTWKDSGDAPALADLTTYTLFLFSGSNASPQQLYSLSAGTIATASTVSVTVPVGTGGTGTNAYFLGMLSVASAGGTIWTYSSRFTMTGMTGSFSAAVAAANLQVTGTTGPDPVNAVADAGTGATSSAAGAWGTPYNLQTGLTKYAPMQPVPPTAITATNTSPLWPTSSVSLATTFLPIPSQVTTLTQANTFSVSSHANTAAAASSPTNDMQRFLNRWKD